jgi:NADH-quinone oxidoreductase subunit I
MSRALDRSGAWIGWGFFADLAEALSLTFGYMFSKSVTMQYPD